MEEAMKKINENRDRQRKEAEAMEALLEMLTEDAPDEMAIDFRIMKAFRGISSSASKLVEEVTISDGYSLEAKKEVLEYLTMVADGIKNYTECVKEQLKNVKED